MLSSCSAYQQGYEAVNEVSPRKATQPKKHWKIGIATLIFAALALLSWCLSLSLSLSSSTKTGQEERAAYLHSRMAHIESHVVSECEEWANPGGAPLPAKQTQVLTTAVTSLFTIHFNLTVNALNTEQKSILYVGDSVERRVPGMWVPNDNQAKLKFSFGTENSVNSKPHNVFIDIELGKKYGFMVYMFHNYGYILVDGEIKASFTLDEEDRIYSHGGLPVYVPWSSKPADVVLTGLTLCHTTTGVVWLSWEFPDPNSPFDNDFGELLDVTHTEGPLDGMYSQYSESHGDRRYALGYGRPVGQDTPMEWSAITETQPTMLNSAWTHECPGKAFIVGVKETISDPSTGEKSIFFRCAEMLWPNSVDEFIVQECEWSDEWSNGYGEVFWESCPLDKAVKSVQSEVIAGTNDRHFKFECCYLGIVGSLA